MWVSASYRAPALRLPPGAAYSARKGVTVATEELEHDAVDQADAHVEEVVADDLVEDVSIDGMCGVY